MRWRDHLHNMVVLSERDSVTREILLCTGVVYYVLYMSPLIAKLFCRKGSMSTATKRSITQHKRHLTSLLLNVAAHNVEVTKHKSYKT
jgi:hypothetical protein